MYYGFQVILYCRFTENTDEISNGVKEHNLILCYKKQKLKLLFYRMIDKNLGILAACHGVNLCPKESKTNSVIHWIKCLPVYLCAH